MKKLLKFIVAVAAAAGVVLGVLYLLRARLGFDGETDEEDESEFDEVFADEMDDREYVTLDLEKEESDEESEPSEDKTEKTEKSEDEE